MATLTSCCSESGERGGAGRVTSKAVEVEATEEVSLWPADESASTVSSGASWDSAVSLRDGRASKRKAREGEAVAEEVLRGWQVRVTSTPTTHDPLTRI